MTSHITTSIDHAMDLAVSVSGRRISVAGGPLRVENRDTSFPGDAVDIVERPVLTVVMGYLVKDSQDNDRIVLLVDEYVQDGVDFPWEFGRGDRYQPWGYLFQIDVPAGAGDLDPNALHVWRMITPAQKKAEEDAKAKG